MSEDQQVTSTEGAFRFLADFCAPTEAICTHDRLAVLDAPRGGFETDHEIADVYCIDCKGLFVATIWCIDRPTELRPMSKHEAARFGPQAIAQAGAA
jgi:hypothetical protein